MSALATALVTGAACSSGVLFLAAMHAVTALRRCACHGRAR